MVQQDTAWRGRRGRAVDEVEVGGGLGGGHEGEGGEEAGEVVMRGGIVCGELEAGDGCCDAEEDGAETFWALEYVGGVGVADVPVLETGGLHEEAEGAGGGGHRGGGGGSGESPRKHVNKAPRLASPPFSSFPLSTASIHTHIPPPLHSHARHPPRTRPRAAHARSRSPRRPRPPCARRQPRRRSPPRRPVRPESQEEAPRRRSQPHHRRGRQVQEETHAVPTARAKGTGKHRSQRLGARKRTGHGYL